MEYNADNEYYGVFSKVRDQLKKDGWKEGKPLRGYKDKISVIFIKDGYALYVLYGCEEDVKDEIL